MVSTVFVQSLVDSIVNVLKWCLNGSIELEQQTREVAIHGAILSVSLLLLTQIFAQILLSGELRFYAIHVIIDEKFRVSMFSQIVSENRCRNGRRW